ncbi:MAG: ABC transporter ATP-binding protein, partial [archaeon GB-1867-035]|nr:ABC transporter ATP-binding protein [Candidatus Culexmicrobium profundum]
MKAVKAINLTKRFGTSIRKKRKIVALRNINFEIDEREHLAIMGPSPSGKTTLLKVIAGIYLPDEGDVEVYGISVRKKAKKVRRLTCYISPQIQLNKKLTIGETLRFFTKISGNKIVRDVRELLESVGITEKIFDKRIEILSDAQVTVLKLALGLIKKPKVLLLDNIFGTLEPRVREIFSTAMEEICESTTLVMVDQELKVLDKFCEKILLLSRDGSMITIGSVENLLETYPYKYDI